ncbi:nucleic-acid-binding protein from transposon X-element [Trichonephila clavipes]|nr:nucleic-acid-binding protein from transposon X-element [Trichonephila clavipes]
MALGGSLPQINLGVQGPAHQNFFLLAKIEINWQNLKKYLLLAQGTEQSLQLLAPHMKADEPEVIDLFARLNFYQEQHQNAEYDKLSGELIKLYTDNSIDYYKLLKLLDQEKYQYHVITPKAERPIKVVVKGLPKETAIIDIKSDLIEQGFPEAKVAQLTGRITKQPLPVFMITLPRNINNAKIFQLKTLSYLSIRIEGYEGTGVTQCYTCNRFNHTSENCHMTPRCLKCGEVHQTKDCPIDRVETAYCINCQTYGHMANYSKCPLFPKPRKGKQIKNNYTTVVDSIVRPNTSYAQVTNPLKPNQPKISQQMAPRVNEAPAISRQIQSNRNFNNHPNSSNINIAEKYPTVCHRANPTTNYEHPSYTHPANCFFKF